MADGPGTPMEKLMAARQQCFEKGKEYDENRERAAISDLWAQKTGVYNVLPPVDKPETFAINADRARAIRFDDREAKQEAEAMRIAGNAQAATLRTDAQMLAAEREKTANLEARLAAAQKRAPLPAAPTAELPPIEGGAVPDESWTVPQMRAWAAERGITVPPEGRGTTSRSVLQAIYDALPKPETAAA